MFHKEEDVLKVWRETLYKKIEEKHLNTLKVSKMLGKSSSWLSGIYSKDKKGWHDFDTVQMIALCHVLECEESDLTAVPSSKKPETGINISSDSIQSSLDGMSYALSCILKSVSQFSNSETTIDETLKAGFNMLHNDIRDLVDTMHMYWKPEMPKVAQNSEDKS